jgi:hypothetical protein
MTVTAKTMVVAISIVGCFDILVSHWVINFNMSQLHAENGLLENLQVALLILTTTAFIAHSLHEGQYHPFYSLSGALLSFSFFIRELDVKALDIPSIFIFLGSGIGKKTMLTMLWLFLIGYGVINYQKIKPRYFRDLVFEKSACTIFLGGGLLILGGLFDRKIIETGNNQFFEELFELNGYYMMLMGVLLCIRQKSVSP